MRRKKQEDPASRVGTTVGIITNSDDRVTSILISLGLSVRLSNWSETQPDFTHVDGSDREAEHIDFVAFSYDIGYEKPDRRIFDAVQTLMKQVKGEDYEYLHVGDDLEKDVNGAKAAGWQSLLLDREEKYVDVLANKIRDLDGLRKLLEL